RTITRTSGRFLARSVVRRAAQALQGAAALRCVIFVYSMPELPEVETVARGLQATVAGRRILSVTLRKTAFIDDPALIRRKLPGRHIARIERFGKFMLLRLSERVALPASAPVTVAGEPARLSEALLVHLGMTGHLAPHLPEQPLAKHT